MSETETTARMPMRVLICGISGPNGAYFEEQSEYVFLAARIGGIYANNTCRRSFVRRNLENQTDVIHGAWRAGIKRRRFLGPTPFFLRVFRI